MAGDWIKVRSDLHEDPAVVRIARETDLPLNHVAGCLTRIWSWFDAQTVDGHAPDVTEEWIDQLAGVTGFAKAMLAARWLDHDGPGVAAPDFEAHMSKCAKKRALGGRRQQKARDGKKGTPAKKSSRRQRDDRVSRVEKKGTAPGGPPSTPPDAPNLAPCAECKGKRVHGVLVSVIARCPAHPDEVTALEQAARCPDCGFTTEPEQAARLCPGCDSTARATAKAAGKGGRR